MRQGAERRIVHVDDALQIDVADTVHRLDTVSQQGEIIGELGNRMRSKDSRQENS